MEESADSPSPDELETFHDSLQRCTERGGFYESFYERLMQADERVPALFEQTEMRRQQRMLHLSLLLVMNLHLQDPEVDGQVRVMARRHIELGIDVGLYDVWLRELLAVVAERDPQYDGAVESAWRAVLRRGIAFMQAQRCAGREGG